MTSPGDESVCVRVACSECDFEEVVSRGGDTTPTDYIVSHGLETGHILNVTTIEE